MTEIKTSSVPRIAVPGEPETFFSRKTVRKKKKKKKKKKKEKEKKKKRKRKKRNHIFGRLKGQCGLPMEKRKKKKKRY